MGAAQLHRSADRLASWRAKLTRHLHGHAFWRTLANAFVILDEAQNTTPMQMKMLLTRLGEGSSMVVTGDLTQIDLPRGVQSGLHEAITVLDGVEGIAFVEFSDTDVVRHPLVGRMVRAYDAYERNLPGRDPSKP